MIPALLMEAFVKEAKLLPAGSLRAPANLVSNSTDQHAAKFLEHLKSRGAGSYSKTLSPTSAAARLMKKPALSAHMQEVGRALVASAPEGTEKETKVASRPRPDEDDGDYAERMLHESGDLVSRRHAPSGTVESPKKGNRKALRRVAAGAVSGALLGSLRGANVAHRQGTGVARHSSRLLRQGHYDRAAALLQAPQDNPHVPAVAGAALGGLLGYGAHQALKSREKKADDPAAALTTRVQGMKQPRTYSPRLRMGTKGQVPVNPFSGNWVKPVKKLADAAFANDVGKTMLGATALLGAGHLAKKTIRATTHPWEQEQGPSARAQSAGVHAARGMTSGLLSQPALSRGARR